MLFHELHMSKRDLVKLGPLSFNMEQPFGIKVHANLKWIDFERHQHSFGCKIGSVVVSHGIISNYRAQYVVLEFTPHYCLNIYNINAPTFWALLARDEPPNA